MDMNRKLEQELIPQYVTDKDYQSFDNDEEFVTAVRDSMKASAAK